MEPDFSRRLIDWQRQHGRHDLPWQADPGPGEEERDPYPIWLSEIMLQQTQVETVIPYYLRFLKRFPDLATLAAASEEAVLAHWSGLGYYSRARNLHAAAAQVMVEHGGYFPRDIHALGALPGIGRSTAAAIAVFAYNHRHAILDGNVKRVLARVFGVDGWPGEKSVENRLWALADALLPFRDVRAYTQGLMDLGATVCTRSRPRCGTCPFIGECVAQREGRQGVLPAPRPRKTLPQRTADMLVICHGGDVLLEKRPSPGIWGGLWSLPECREGETAAQAVLRLGYQSMETERLPALDHAFTHFRLHIQPWLVTVARPARVEAPGNLWLSLGDLEGGALPSPVRKILARL
jgi:A/G-specific adenine glycosylase